jgi:hypothetical protein
MGMGVESSEDTCSRFESGVAATAVQDDKRIRRFYMSRRVPSTAPTAKNIEEVKMISCCTMN